MTGRELRDKLYKDDEFLDLLSMVRDTYYARQNCIYQIGSGAIVIDFDSDSDITILILLIAKAIKQDSSMTDKQYEDMLMKIVKKFLFSITTLFYIWDHVTTASYTDSSSKLKYKLGFARGEAKVPNGTYDYSITFKLLEELQCITASLYVKPYTDPVTVNLDPVAVSVIVSKDSIRDDMYLQYIQFYFHNTVAKDNFYRTLGINNIDMNQLMVSIRDASTRNC